MTLLKNSLTCLAAVAVSIANAAAPYSTIGEIKSYSPEFSAIVAPGTRIERLTENKFGWAEGPLFIPGTRKQPGYLLASDVPGNAVYRWREKEGLTLFLQPSGLAEPDPAIREGGTNGLFLESPTTVLAADSGNRRITRIDLVTEQKTAVVTRFQGKRFNSPNDVVRSRDGSLYFTDPPYGLKGFNQSPLKELAFNGVYRVAPDGTITLIDDSLSFPNGIALSPDERTLYVSNSDAANPVWMAYTLSPQGQVIAKREFADARDLVALKLPGMPDGLKVANNGILFASAPGGILVMKPDGQRLGLISTGVTIANCNFGDDGRSLYLTSSNFLARVRLTIKAR